MPMQMVNPEVLAQLMPKAGFKTGLQPSEELVRLAALVVEHCAEIADAHRELPGQAARQIRAEWDLD